MCCACHTYELHYFVSPLVFIKPPTLEIAGAKVFFRGVGPRALSNGLNSAIFFCFFEAFRHALIKKQQQQLEAQLAESRVPGKGVRARRQPVAACLSLAVPVPRVPRAQRPPHERRTVQLVA